MSSIYYLQVFFSSYNGSVRLAFRSWETKNLVSLFAAVNYAQNRLYYSPLSSNWMMEKDDNQRIIHTNMNTANFISSWLNLYDILYGRANANATIFVFNWKVNIKEQRCLILFAFIESYAQNFPAAKMRYKGFAFSK